MSLEAVLITSVIDAYEGREVAIVDVTGAFLTEDQDKVINMTLRGKLSELTVKTAKEVYRKYVIIKKRKYGIIRTATKGAIQMLAHRAPIL